MEDRGGPVCNTRWRPSWTTARADLTPEFTTFGPLPGATFGGSGIPNDAVAITTIVDGTTTITLGLTAHQRFASPAVTNNGAGVFTAQAGVFRRLFYTHSRRPHPLGLLDPHRRRHRRRHRRPHHQSRPLARRPERRPPPLRQSQHHQHHPETVSSPTCRITHHPGIRHRSRTARSPTATHYPLALPNNPGNPRYGRFHATRRRHPSRHRQRTHAKTPPAPPVSKTASSASLQPIPPDLRQTRPQRTPHDLLHRTDGGSTAESALGNINFISAPGSLAQGSENLGFNYLANGIPGIVTPPTYTPFSALAAGQYTFALRASSLTGTTLGQSVIQVNTIPEPSTLLGALARFPSPASSPTAESDSPARPDLPRTCLIS